MKSFNINNTVKVKLTEYGKRMLERDHNNFWSSHGEWLCKVPTLVSYVSTW
jgi:hypothetical protein